MDNAPTKHQMPPSISQLRYSITHLSYSLCHWWEGKMAMKINQMLAAPLVVWRGAVTIWMGWELGQETINKARRSVRRHPSTFSQGPKVKTPPDFADGATPDLRKEPAS